MLTADLLRVRDNGKTVSPRFLKLDGKAARVRRGRGADSCIRTQCGWVYCVCVYECSARSVQAPGMARVLKTSCLSSSSRMPVDAVPLGSEDIELVRSAAPGTRCAMDESCGGWERRNRKVGV